MRLREWTYEDGLFSYGQRIAAGDILSDDSRSEYMRLKDCWRELYGWNARLMPPRMRARRFARMMKGLRHWFDLEAQTLRFTPSASQERAGIAQMFAEVGHMGTVKAMAEKFSMDPDAVLRWEWAKVYGILIADLREYEYEQRYARQMNHGRG